MIVQRNAERIVIHIGNDEVIRKSIEFDELCLALRKIRRKADEIHKKWIYEHFDIKEIDFSKMNKDVVYDIMTQLQNEGWELEQPRNKTEVISRQNGMYKYKRNKNDTNP